MIFPDRRRPQTMNPDRILAIIPAHNERAAIDRVVKATLAQGYDVLVMDDFSLDDTVEIATKAGATVISLPINLGYAGALQLGYNYAVRSGYQYIVQLDGDGQHDPAHCQRLLEPVMKGEADIAFGSRFLGEECYRVPTLRRLGHQFFAWFAGMWLKERITDPTTGFQALNRKVALFFCSDAFPVDYPDADLRILLARLHFKTTEVPVRMLASEGASMHDGLHRQLYYVYKMTLAILIAPFKKLSGWKGGMQ